MYPFYNLNAQNKQHLTFSPKEKKVTPNTINSDSLLIFYQVQKQQFLKENDTLKAINAALNISKISTNKGHYAQSYDSYWDALILANKTADSTYLGEIYTGLGVLYSMFNKDVKAEKYFDASLNILRKQKQPKSKLVNNFYLLSSHHRENGNYGKAQKYLDSCISYSKDKFLNGTTPFTQAEQAYIYFYQGKVDQAIKILKEVERFFIIKNSSYLVMLYSILGDIYLSKHEYKLSESYYLKSLFYSEKYKSHQNYIPKTYEKLSELYLVMGQLDIAYQYLKRSKKMDEELFGARSMNNSNILEIKDNYRVELEQQKKAIEKSKIIELEQEQKNLFLRNLILSISIGSLLIISGIIVWYLFNKRKTEKDNFIHKQKLSHEKNTEVLELKNKELTSSALQLIQKDELILQIKDKLLTIEGADNKIINQIINLIKINKSHDWEEFNARFTSVNKKFYQTLTSTYPELTRKDQRLCALIKLNFSSKDISQLLGISMESVNTSRYRLRKKMKLNKDDNLHNLISKL